MNKKQELCKIGLSKTQKSHSESHFQMGFDFYDN